MTREVQVRNKRIALSPKALIGQGGEAEVFGIGKLDRQDPELALKVWYPPDHPQFAGKDAESIRNRDAAKARLTEYGAKLLRFPAGLPSRVVTPRDLAYATDTQAVAGYTMTFLEGMEQLRSFSQRRYRDQAGIDVAQVVKIFTDLHATVAALHGRGVVVGDFNNLNVLVRDREAYLIDADSMQFGGFMSRAFTERYVDPLICDQKATRLIQNRPHTEYTDWYAFAVMLFESMLYVHPYGGVYEPKRKRDNIPLDARPLTRISVLNSEVVYPAKGVPLTWLPDRVRAFYDELLTKDRRGEFPQDLLVVLQAHAEGRYVDPATVPTAARVQEILRGDLTARKLWSISSGVLIDSGIQNGQAALVVHRNGEYQRQDGTTLVKADLNPQLTIRAHADRTLMAMGGKLVVLDARGGLLTEHLVESYQGRFPVLDSNGEHYYWLSNGQLYRDGALGPTSIGPVLTNQTQIWAGRGFGFGFYRTGAGTTGFIFDVKRSGLKDLRLPAFDGELLSARCYFSERRAWFLTTNRVKGKLINRCTVIKIDGTVTAQATATEGDGSWLGEITGHAAARIAFGGTSESETLLAATDRGLIVVAEDGSSISEIGQLSGLNGIIDSTSTLFYEPGRGLFAATGTEVWHLSHPSLRP
jgi:H/ACA ribonucleoprotein complex subunit 3